MYNRAIVPEGFQVPEILETDRLKLRPLTVHDAIKDFDAVMTSAERLKTVFDPGGVWPDGLTLEQNLIELSWHQVEFQMRTSFAFTVVSPDETRVLGCLYIYPTRKRGHDVEITMWVRQSEAESGLDEHLYAKAREWIEQVWPFANPAYPGRDIDWESWRSLPED